MKRTGLAAVMEGLDGVELAGADSVRCADLLRDVKLMRGWLDATEARITARVTELRDSAGAAPAADVHARCGGVSAAEGKRKERRSRALGDAPEFGRALERTLATGDVDDTSVCETADGLDMPPASVRRLLCNGRVTPIIVDVEGNSLNAGRMIRHANRQQRRALRAMYRTCAFGDCDVPFDRCEIHHLRPWEHGGSTDLSNLAPRLRQAPPRRPRSGLEPPSRTRSDPGYRATRRGRVRQGPTGCRRVDSSATPRTTTRSVMHASESSITDRTPDRRRAGDRYRPCVLRMSKLFLRTLRDDPSDAEVPSHRLLVRAGYIRRAAPGGFTWLPLGWIVFRNVERIVREEMDAAGFQEVHFPALLPKEPYEATGRYADYGDNLFRLEDRHGNDFILAPTHEEMFTLLVKDLLSSYKDLPLSIYQIQTKYRDEARPRAGLLRGREFVMKDSYSFDLDDESFMRSYQAHRDAYIKTFERLGLPIVIVSAMSGAMGGSASEEFLAPAEVGEDTYVRCTACDYASNVEAVRTPIPDAVPFDDARPATVVDTPGTPTIHTLVDHLNAHDEFARPEGPWTAADTLKNVIVKLRHPDGTFEPIAVGVPGDRDVDLKRLGAQVEPSEVEAFDEADFAKNPALVKGYIGPGALGTEGSSGIRFLVDPRIVDGTRWVTGADEPGRHVIDLTFGRDFSADGVIEAAEVRDGDVCPNCGGDVEIARGIEMGHIFQLGRKYSEALDLQVQDESGKRVTPTMGSYGIGVSRAVAALAEANHDDIGLVWPREVSPADVHLVIAGKEGGPQRPAAEELAAEMEAAGLRVLFDDREGVSPGVRFKDAELIGVPTIVVVGRGITDGNVEVKDRRSGEREDVPVGDVVAGLVAGF